MIRMVIRWDVITTNKRYKYNLLSLWPYQRSKQFYVCVLISLWEVRLCENLVELSLTCCGTHHQMSIALLSGIPIPSARPLDAKYLTTVSVNNYIRYTIKSTKNSTSTTDTLGTIYVHHVHPLHNHILIVYIGFFDLSLISNCRISGFPLERQIFSKLCAVL